MRRIFTRRSNGVSIIGLAVILTGCCVFFLSTTSRGEKTMNDSDWRAKLAAALPIFGHRNWIVVADSAYPAQSGQGIETVYAGGDHLAALGEVLRAVSDAKHVSPVIHLDQELQSVPEADAPGIDEFRGRMAELLKGRSVKRMLHEDIIRELDKAGKLYRILIIKTDMRLPYTTMFIQLDCGYWGPEQESRLRKAMKESKSE